jgi:predicted nucleic acid-binding protein
LQYLKRKGLKLDRLDTMIAASAILAGAELATTNRDDFAAFVPHGLKLHPVD